MQLYPFQQKVKSLVQQGRSVVLQAPTGTGKTRAALAPFIEDFYSDKRSKCLYQTPLRVLASSFYAEYNALAQRFNHPTRVLHVTVQTGDQPQDPEFQGNLIFATIDQSLSSYLHMPFSLPRRRANLNAGALSGAYLVFDEFHLFDPEVTLPTVLHAVQRLSRVNPVVLMTATFSAHMLHALAAQLHNAEVVVPTPEEIQHILALGGKPRQRIWRAMDEPLTAQLVLDRHKHRSLVICNTVEEARRHYRDIVELTQGSDTEVRLLHSRFLPEDRRRIEDWLRRTFGKDADRTQGSAILVATQVVEVGVDISAEVLHTQLAPVSALIQRAGRCARFPGESGEVLVYPVDSYAPYAYQHGHGELWAQEMDAAWAWVRAHTGQVIGFVEEQALVDAVSTARDKQILNNIAAGAHERDAEVKRCWRGYQDRAARLLVRDVNSRRVLVHHDPAQLLADPFAATGFSLPLPTLLGMTKAWLDQPAEGVPWRVQRLVEEEDADDRDARFAWQPINDYEEIIGASVIVVHPALAGYTPLEGFLHDRGNTGFISTLPRKAAAPSALTRLDGGYTLETYEDHIKRVLGAFREIARPELASAFDALDRAAGWADGSTRRAAWLACLLHDVGKLSVAWQKWAHDYQCAIGQPVDPSTALAHTTFDPANHAHADAEARLRQRKPRHAAEGALACAEVISRALDRNKELTQAVVAAIARHHAPFAATCDYFELRKDAADHIQRTLAFVPKTLVGCVNLDLLWTQPRNRHQFDQLIPDDGFGWIAYTLLVRALRRADQLGTASAHPAAV